MEQLLEIYKCRNLMHCQMIQVHNLLIIKICLFKLYLLHLSLQTLKVILQQIINTLGVMEPTSIIKQKEIMKVIQLSLVHLTLYQVQPMVVIHLLRKRKLRKQLIKLEETIKEI